MSDDFIDNLTSLTDNLEDIAFTRYVTITNVNSDGTVDCKEENGVIHKNIRTNNFMEYKLDDIVILGFVDNDIYEPFIIGGSDIDIDLNYSDLLEIIENYETLSDTEYTLFRGDCWTINNNFEASAAVTSTSDDNLTVTGTFRTKQDMVGLYWNSEDIIKHPYISYGNRAEYSNVILEFDYNMSGCRDFSNTASTITINTNAGEIFYVPLSDFVDDGHVTIPFNNLKIPAGSSYLNNKGEWIVATEETSVEVVNIKNIMFVLIPTAYESSANTYTIMANVDFTCEITNIEVTNGFIKREHIPLNPHKYRLAEDYDDIYNLNPLRLAKEMRKLGYTEWCDLYIGASHYYEKNGTVGDTITDLNFNHNRTEKMKVKTDTPLNKAFIAWLDCYSNSLKAYDIDKLIISVSMENLQCDTAWRQKDVNGNYAETLWVPSTFFYSPCNADVITYMKSVSKACLDIVVNNDMQPILQLGEAWWWWNEHDRPNQPPCFYDDSTKAKYLAAFGSAIPSYESTSDTYDSNVTAWLNQQLVAYADEIGSVVKNTEDYGDGLYLALFFPPSVTDVDRVPSMMREVNYIRDAYTPLKLDVFELEDYDWVIGESPHHGEVYSIGSELNFTPSQLHYYGGFVQYPEDSHRLWKLIKTAMDTAFDKKFGEVFVWAGTQIRRDNKYIGYDGYEVVSSLLNQAEVLNAVYEYLTKLVVHGGYDDTEIRQLLDNKVDKEEGKGLFSGSYNDLTDKPTIPEDVADLTDLHDTAFTPKPHTHDDRYYTESEVNSIIEQTKHDLLNRVTITAENTVIQTDMVCDVRAYVIENGIPVIKDVYFYKKEV